MRPEKKLDKLADHFIIPYLYTRNSGQESRYTWVGSFQPLYLMSLSSLRIFGSKKPDRTGL